MEDMQGLALKAFNGSFRFNVVDAEARAMARQALDAAIGTSPIQYIESLDESNLKNLRDLTTGSYVLYGYFRPYAGAPNFLPFDNLLVNVYHVDEGSHLFEFSTANSEVNFIEILVDSTAADGFTYTRTAINMLDLSKLIGRVATLEASATLRVAEIALPAANWREDESYYSQVVAIDGITANSQVDLTPSVEQLAIFHNKDLTFVTENEDGVVTVYAIGQRPENDYTIQVTIKEVAT